MALPTGNQLRAARALAGLRAAQLAKSAGVDASTVSRLENARHKSVSGMAQTVDAVLRALARAGVRINEDGSVGPIEKPRR
jgi:transcriptional regulator with XRE-family HTH domain